MRQQQLSGRHRGVGFCICDGGSFFAARLGLGKAQQAPSSSMHFNPEIAPLLCLNRGYTPFWASRESRALGSERSLTGGPSRGTKEVLLAPRLSNVRPLHKSLVRVVQTEVTGFCIIPARRWKAAARDAFKRAAHLLPRLPYIGVDHARTPWGPVVEPFRRLP